MPKPGWLSLLPVMVMATTEGDGHRNGRGTSAEECRGALAVAGQQRARVAQETLRLFNHWMPIVSLLVNAIPIPTLEMSQL